MKQSLRLYALFMGISLLLASVARAELASSPEAIDPLLVGERIPDVTLRDAQGSRVSLGEKLEEKPTLLIVYRGGWCPYCTRHLSGLAGVSGDIRDHGFQIIGVSPDRPGKVAEARKEVDADYTLLSDSDLDLAQALGIAFKVPDDLVSKYKNEYGIDLEADSGRTHHGLPVPAAYLIDTDGTILFSYVNPNYRVRIPGEIVLAAAEAYVDGWTAR